jgi:hypothetical protein
MAIPEGYYGIARNGGVVSKPNTKLSNKALISWLALML